MAERSTTPKEGWHLDKKVPVSIIFVLIAQFIGGVMFMQRLDGRVTTLEVSRSDALSQQRDRDEHQDRENADAFTLMRAQLEKMDGKLDRLIESRRQP